MQKRYEKIKNDFKTKPVDYPDEEALVFDVETLVLHENCPVIAVAVSSTAWFVDAFILIPAK